jgi:hypothetical protein
MGKNIDYMMELVMNTCQAKLLGIYSNWTFRPRS